MLAVSLPSPYLAAARDHPDAALWRSMLGPPSLGLAALAGLGVDAIEVADVRGHVDGLAVTRSLQTIEDAGLKPHAHLWIPRGFDPTRPPVPLLAAVKGLEHWASIVGRPHCAACAVHGHRRHDPDAVAATVRDLHEFDAWLRRHGACAALEVCRFKPEGPLGGTFDETAALAAQAGREVGITWDLGHTTWNHLQGHDTLWPEARFLERVRHVHVHDLGPTGRTHFPLDEERADLAGFVERLRGAGYGGLWNLELYPDRWPGSAAERRARLEASVVRLAEAVA